MAGLKELNSFLGKFVNLWQSGMEATLRIDSKAGQATINLEVGLGQAPQPEQHPICKYGPSRLRRRERRADARKLAEEVTEDTAEQAATSNTSEKTTSTAEEAEELRVEKAQAEADKVKAVETTEVPAKDASEKVDDEFCSNESFGEGHSPTTKPTPTPSSAAAAAPTPSSRRGLGGVDYYLLSYEDPSDSD
jgi:hypothetical protein